VTFERRSGVFEDDTSLSLVGCDTEDHTTFTGCQFVLAQASEVRGQRCKGSTPASPATNDTDQFLDPLIGFSLTFG